MSKFFAEEYKIVPVGSDIDLSTAAANDCDSINMKNYHHATFLVNFQTLGGAAIYVALYSGATDGAKTSALTFQYALGSAAQGSTNCDVLSAWSTVTTAASGVTIAHATYDNYLMVIEAPSTIMDLANNEDWLTLSFLDTDTEATGNVSVIAILKPRYINNQSGSALV